MKTKISLLIAAVAILTLSFTFVKVESTPGNENLVVVSQNSTTSTPVGGFMADDVVK